MIKLDICHEEQDIKKKIMTYNREYTPEFFESRALSKRPKAERITSLKTNEIFVFGSNIHGMHGGGAARVAFDHFGAPR